jgi:hypothetical protein
MTPHDPMSDDELERIRTRCDAATAGPWSASIEGRDHDSGSSFIATVGNDIELIGASEADYDFIASARQDVPRLLAEVRALRALLSQDDHAKE